MKRRIVLHIGASKTGSSAIQAFLARNRQYFGENGFVIPDRHLEFSSAVTGEHVFALEKLLNDTDSSTAKDAFARLRDEPAEGQTVLLSAENLSNLGKHHLFNELLSGFDAKVILYIRRQDDLLCSAWQQWHSKVERDLHAWIIKALMVYGHWDRVIDNWESVVGQGNVVARVFQREDMVEGDLLRDFLDALGLDARTDEPSFDVGDVNPSYNDIITPLVTANPGIFEGIHDNDFYKMIGKLTGTTYRDMKKVSLITREQRDSIVHYYSRINQRVCQKHFPGRPALFSGVKHANYDYIGGEEMTARQIKFLTALVYKIGQRGA